MKIFNGAPGLSPKMSEHQVTTFLCSGKMNLQFGSIDEKNEPNIHPVWFIYENERFYFATEVKSKKIQNIKQNKNVYFSVANEVEPFIGVRGKGESQILEDKSQNYEIGKKIISKYLGNKESRLAKEVMDEIKEGLEVIVEIKPQYFSAWTFKP
jgi:nitroimidazol reductase NimA-like FMN-containing flavoprotein (pyridoxamine 5'-phosphate oxidase superfamily)